jgi:single-stranded-DNA-specific exonuclease
MKWKIKSTERKKDVITQLLKNRDVDTDQKNDFLNPDIKKLYDPIDLPDIEEAARQIDIAARKKDKVAIFADYDADGIPGAVLMKEILDQLGVETLTYIPTREEGYGLSVKALNYFDKNNCKLLITIDCGVSNLKELDYWSNRKNLPAIVLDHHETKDNLPKVEAVVDAKRSDSNYPFREISGAAVVFKLGQYLADKGKISKNLLKRSLDLIAISTITDMVPLVDENRILAYYGLIVLRQSKRIGLKKMFEQAHIDQKTISTYQVGFQIGPRINAPGRVDHANIAYRLLLEDNSRRADQMAKRINQINKQRQDMLEDTFEQAVKKIESGKLHRNKIILVSGKSWPKGVAGLVASRIKEKYYRPTIVLSKDDDYSEGSARTIQGFHILNALTDSAEILDRFGGHNQAAGLRLRNDYLDSLYNNLLEYSEEKISANDLEPKLKIDCYLDFDQISFDLVRQLERLEPHGVGNPKPVFVSKNIDVLSSSLVGKESNHLKLKLKDKSNKIIDAIAFEMGCKRKAILSGSGKIDIAYNINENKFNGSKQIDLIIKDIKIKNGKR